MSTIVKMSLQRDTKGTLVYQELNELGSPLMNNRDGTIPSVYVQKSSEVGRAAPKNITVTIDW